MTAERPHGQMIGDDVHRWQGDPSSFEKRRRRRLARQYGSALTPTEGSGSPNAGELRRLLDAATPGEWDAEGRTLEARCVTSNDRDHPLHTAVAVFRDDEYIFNERAEADAELTSAMKAALPWYLENHELLQRAGDHRAAPLLYALMKIARSFPDTPSLHAQRLKRIALQAIDASGMSAGTAETRRGSGLQPASPVGEAETPKPPSE